jgi:hypothetical protein
LQKNRRSSLARLSRLKLGKRTRQWGLRDDASTSYSPQEYRDFGFAQIEVQRILGLKACYAVTEEENEVETSEPRDLPADVRLITKRHHQAAYAPKKENRKYVQEENLATGSYYRD